MPLYRNNDLDRYTWAARPAGANLGKRIRITDYGTGNGLIVTWDGTRWVLDGPQVLTKFTPANVTGVTTEVTLASFVIPPGLLGPTGSCRISPLFSGNNSGNSKFMRVRFGSTIVYAANVGSGISGRALVHVQNLATNSQVSAGIGPGNGNFAGIGLAGSSKIASAEDTTAAVTVLVTGALAVTTDNATLEAGLVEVLP